MNNSNEPILGFLTAERTDRLSWDYFLLCFTANRLIVAKVGHHNDFWAIIYNSFFNAPGAPTSETFLNSTEKTAQLRITELQQQTPIEILSASSSNFQITFGEIEHLTIRRATRGATILTLITKRQEMWFSLTNSHDHIENTIAGLVLPLGRKLDYNLPPPELQSPIVAWFAARGYTRWLVIDTLVVILNLSIGAVIGWGLGTFLNSVGLGPNAEILLAVLGLFLGLWVGGTLNNQLDEIKTARVYTAKKLKDSFGMNGDQVLVWLQSLNPIAFGGIFGLVFSVFQWLLLTVLCGAILGFVIAGSHSWNPWQTAVYGAAYSVGAIALLGTLLGGLINALREYSLRASWIIPVSIGASFALTPMLPLPEWRNYWPCVAFGIGISVGLGLCAALNPIIRR